MTLSSADSACAVTLAADASGRGIWLGSRLDVIRGRCDEGAEWQERAG
jgi:hypothetical protein